MEDVSTAQPKRRLDPQDARFRSVVLTITGAITTAVAVVTSPSWPIACLIAALIVLGVAFALSVAKRLDELKQANIETAEKLERCQAGHQACQNELHVRDVLLAMFHVSMKPRGRRKADGSPSALEHAFRRTLGERADAVIDEARRILASD